MIAESATTAGPNDLDQPPKIGPNPVAIDAYVAQADADARSPGFDEHSAHPVQPSKDLVLETARTPLVRLGERFHAFYIRYTSGMLGHVVPKEVTARQILRGMWHYMAIGTLVLIAAITVEVIYGSTAADLLARDEHAISLRAAIAATLIFNGGAWFFTDIAYRHNPHLAHRRGLRIAVFGFIAIAVPVLILGLVIGGWDAVAAPTSEGGGANTPPSTDVDHRWLLAGAYITLVILATVVTAAGHYLLLDTYHTRHINQVKANEKAARDASLTPAQQQESARRLAQAYLDTIPIAHHHAETRLRAYNSAFAHRIGPELNGRVDRITYTPLTPEWKPIAESLRDRAGYRTHTPSESNSSHEVVQLHNDPRSTTTTTISGEGD